jgi:hypothetical protein
MKAPRTIQGQAGAVIVEYAIAAAMLLAVAVILSGMWRPTQFGGWLRSVRSVVLVRAGDARSVGRELTDR